MTKLFSCAILALGALPALAGPPLICHPIDIGTAKSLPWKPTTGWSGADPAYDVARLADDTMALLDSSEPVPVRMETMRRASIYAARASGLSERIATRLTARALNSEAAGRRDALVWFDAGYWIESIRQAAFIHRYGMLPEEERSAWRIRTGLEGLDGYPWVQKAIRLGGKGMDHALSLMEDYRNSDRKQRSE